MLCQEITVMSIYYSVNTVDRHKSRTILIAAVLNILIRSFPVSCSSRFHFMPKWMILAMPKMKDSHMRLWGTGMFYWSHLRFLYPSRNFTNLVGKIRACVRRFKWIRDGSQTPNYSEESKRRKGSPFIVKKSIGNIVLEQCVFLDRDQGIKCLLTSRLDLYKNGDFD